jgi:hypothetical protein
MHCHKGSRLNAAWGLGSRQGVGGWGDAHLNPTMIVATRRPIAHGSLVCYCAVTALTERFCQNAPAPSRGDGGRV